MQRYLSMFAECHGVNGKVIILMDNLHTRSDMANLFPALECFFTNLECHECLKTLVAKRIRRACAFRVRFQDLLIQCNLLANGIISQELKRC